MSGEVNMIPKLRNLGEGGGQSRGEAQLKKAPCMLGLVLKIHAQQFLFGIIDDESQLQLIWPYERI